MSGILIDFLSDQPLMRVIAALLRAQRPRYLRELVSVCKLSPGGVSDILRRLKALGVLAESEEGNRKYYELRLSEKERGILGALFNLFEENRLKERAKTFSINAENKLAWMDEISEFYQEIKKTNK